MQYHYSRSVLGIFLCIYALALFGSAANVVVHTPCTQPAEILGLVSEKGFLVTEPAQKKQTPKRIRKTKLVVRTVQGQLSLNGTKTRATELHLEPLDGTYTCNGQKYTGSLTVRCAQQLVACVYHPKQEVVQKKEQPVAVTQEREKIKAQEQPAQVSEPVPQTNQYQVRVLLAVNDVGVDSWSLHAPGGFVVYGCEDATKRVIVPESDLTVRVAAHGIVCNNKRYMSEFLYIMPIKPAHHIGYDGKKYQGTFLVMRSKGRALLINRVELEDYVFSVLRTESFPGWPLEVNKAFAIACRSYAIAMIVRARGTSQKYHIRNTNHHQTYTGVHECNHLRVAVDETKGVFLAHAGEPILAMFDACCGGIIPAHVSDFDFVKAPYLARDYPCTFCKRCKVYDWQAEYSHEQLIKLLKPEVKRIDKIHDIRITKKDKAGLVKKIAVHGSKTQTTITGKRLYGLLKEVRSFCFSVSKNAEGIVFTGRGYGHHLGICQWGAREMVRDGHDYLSVLAFYYPNTTRVRLQYDQA